MTNGLMNLINEGFGNVNGAIITSSTNRYYLTGFKSSAGILLLAGKKALFIVDFRYIESATSTIKGIEVVLQKDDGFEQIREFFKSNDCYKVCIESAYMTIMNYNKFKDKLQGFDIVCTNEISNKISSLREIKTQDEIDKIKKAQDITDKTFDYICGYLNDRLTEKDIALEIEYKMKSFGATGLAFDTIVASGINGALPHAVPSNKKLSKGEFVTMDFGAVFDGYCSDMTRTIAFGEVSIEQKKIYDTVLEAQILALNGISDGKTGYAIDALAREYITQNGYGEYFGHGLGHSLGLDVHENPRFSPKCNDVMKAGMVMTVEPGIYISSKYGVRIEDLVIITKSSCEILTKSPKNLIIL